MIISSPINSKNGIHVCLETPYGRRSLFNVYRESVLRQYFGEDVSTSQHHKTVVRYSYGIGSGAVTVKQDPSNMVTRRMTFQMSCLAEYLHEHCLFNKSILGFDDVDLSTQFNHCTIIIYYTSPETKKVTTLPLHADSLYSVNTGKFSINGNSQRENTPTVVYSLGDEREVNWKRRFITLSSKGRKNRNMMINGQHVICWVQILLV